MSCLIQNAEDIISGLGSGEKFITRRCGMLSYQRSIAFFSGAGSLPVFLAGH